MSDQLYKTNKPLRIVTPEQFNQGYVVADQDMNIVRFDYEVVCKTPDGKNYVVIDPSAEWKYIELEGL